MNLPAIALGVGLHVFYFRKFEHHMYGVRYLQLFLSSVLFSTYWLMFSSKQSLTQCFLESLPPHIYLLLGIYASLVTYRLLLHPLRRFPGPFPAKISSLWFSTQLGKSEAHKKILALHLKYGPFVRIGSSDLSIAHPLGVTAVYGPKSACRKASWYDEDHPRASIHTTRDHEFHARRRRVWSHAFSDKALRGYEVRIAKYTARLIAKLEQADGAAINVSQWFKHFSFDVMGDLAFAKDFGMLKSGQEHWAVGLLNEALGVQAMKLPTWIFRIIVAVPGLTRNYWKFIRYCDEQLDQRIKSKAEVPDLMSTLLEHAGSRPISPDEYTTLQADSRTIIVAGSDTTAATLAHVFYQLARHPGQVRKVREELKEVLGDFSSASPSLENRKLQHADHINAVIYETLRLHPAVPSAIVRKTPPEGIRVGETYIPGDMNVWCPQYVLGRLEDVYEKPLEFLPERWYTQPEMVREKSAFAPFLVGTYGCIGRPLAMMEMRAVIAEIVMRYDVDFVEGDDGEAFIEGTSDQFTLHLAHLDLRFRCREKAQKTSH
ncbi:putative cytochrome P450 [Polyplosphaeria fusca]|uniref:Cytochrome P450 n=1 Tax=Polyplosphaeria fusca TaxID=682080 RepID=A0A9P4V3M1_9PLEO|nr:putative cytochrome P450 [Polyplosphaeria fusca]